jgi:Ca2+-binding RTX toxin-like protein
MLFRRRSKPAHPNPCRLHVEALEGRACPATLIPPPVVNTDYVVTGESGSDTEDLVVVTPGPFGTVRILHHVGNFHFDAQGNAVSDNGPVLPRLVNDVVVNMANRRLVVNAGPGADIVVNHAAVRCNLEGGAGNDELFGGPAADTISGGTGDDFLGGREGPDELYGGPDQDTLTGHAGADYLYGEHGTDRLIGGNSPEDNDDGAVDYLDGNWYFDGTTWQSNDGFIDRFFVEWRVVAGNVHRRHDTLGTFVANHDIETQT